MTIVALLGPITAMFYETPWSTQIQVIGTFWVSSISLSQDIYEPAPPISTYVNPDMFISLLPFSILRYIFVLLMYRFYSGKTTKRRAILTGIISELIMPIFYLITLIPSLILTPYGYEFYFPILIPTPLLFLIGYAIIRFRPPHEDEVWIDRDTTKKWWDKSVPATDSPVIHAASADETTSPDSIDDWLVDERK